MQRKNFGRDRGLSLRMFLTSALLGLLYVVFAVVLFSVFNFSLIAMLVIVIGIAVFQYFSSAKIALAASGAKIVSAEEAPELHAMVERLCAMANLPKPQIAVVDSDVPNAFATGRNPKHAAVAVTAGPGSRGGAGWRGGSGGGASHRRSRPCWRTSSRTLRTGTCW